jgi:hypothetical protein
MPIVELVHPPLAHIGDDALMRRASRFAIELIIRYAAHRHTRLLGHLEQMPQTLIAAAPGAHRHHASGFQCFSNRVDAVDEHKDNY